MLERCTAERFAELKDNKKICVIGVGRYGQEFITQYSELLDKFVLFDNDPKKQKEGIWIQEKRFEISRIADIVSYSKQDILIMICSSYYHEMYMQIVELIDKETAVFIYPFISTRRIMLQELTKQCLELYCKFECMGAEETAEYIGKKEKQYRNKEKMILPYLPIYLTTRCTLNCEKCNNLMPKIKECHLAKDFSASRIINSISQILQNVDEMIFCELVGGEPFLYQDLETILTFVGEQKKINKIVMVSNATVIPNERILCLLQKYKVTVRISDYGLLEKMSQFVFVLEQRGIGIEISQNIKWYDAGEINQRGCTENELYFQYNKCSFSLQCKYLMENKLYTCARIASLDLLGEKIASEDVLEVNEDLTTDQLQQFYLQDWGSGCDYCDMCSIYGCKSVEAAVQVGNHRLHKSQYTIIKKEEYENLSKNRLL